MPQGQGDNKNETAKVTDAPPAETNGQGEEYVRGAQAAEALQKLSDADSQEAVVDGDEMTVPAHVRQEQLRKDSSLNIQLGYVENIVKLLEDTWASLNEKLPPILGEYETGEVVVVAMDPLPNGASPTVAKTWDINRRLAEVYKQVREANNKIQL